MVILKIVNTMKKSADAILDCIKKRFRDGIFSHYR